jgi:hypothetical protein
MSLTTVTDRPVRRRRALITSVALAAVTDVGVAGAAPAQAGPAAPEVPANIAVVGPYRPYLVGHAVGWQVHHCAATTTGFAWAFDGPVATLHDDHQKLIATHAAGPTWTARDGSTVAADVVDRAFVSPTAIPWLLLRTRTASSGPDGDRLAATTHVQRTATTGGVTPAPAECTADSVGETRSVPYTADYVFWKKTGTGS